MYFTDRQTDRRLPIGCSQLLAIIRQLYQNMCKTAIDVIA